ncbi:hypothetical protein, partial [Olavius algarvensis spirochete endosymbiont]|uniref:hypothetical protein n=1 Tax=Olavius algarvensis spirochete endosymbiont TaxID=260710 RepID=UPI0011CEB66C
MTNTPSNESLRSTLDEVDVPLVGSSNIKKAAIPQDSIPRGALNPFKVEDALEYKLGVNFSMGGDMSFSGPLFTIWVLEFGIKAGFGASAGYSSMNATVLMRDLTGDGLPD